MVLLTKVQYFDITLKYLEKGHTQNENDSIHSAYFNIHNSSMGCNGKKCSQKYPYNVKEMSVEDFYDFKLLSSELKNFDTNIDNEKEYWNSFKTLMFSITEPDMFQYKADYEGDTLSVDLLRQLTSF